MSLFLLYSLCLGLAILVVIMGAVFGPFQICFRRRNNHLALVPVAPRPVQPEPEPYDPWESSSWHKGLRAHIEYLAQYVHVPPNLDENGIPEDLYSHLLVLAMLQNLFRTGQLQRPIVVTPSEMQLVPFRADNNQNRQGEYDLH